MRILITGNLGYVGSVLVRHLNDTNGGSQIVGYDAGWFAHCLSGTDCWPETLLGAQYFGDVRDFPPELLEGIDAVIHLAALSNDPIGNRFERVTDAINHQSTRLLAKSAAERGVKRFVFASSCSMYGSAQGGPRSEKDPLNPLTAYARSKSEAEESVGLQAGSGMIVTALRFATACGMSERLRLDLVLNDFVANAITFGEIKVLSDGTPWRPLIDVEDMARAVEWALIRDAEVGGPFVVVNVGCDRANYQVSDLADAVATEIPGTRVTVNRSAINDMRSYKVNFSLYKALAPFHQPKVDIHESIRRLKFGIEEVRSKDPNFFASRFERLRVLKDHISAGRLNEDLRWRRHFDLAHRAGEA